MKTIKQYSEILLIGAFLTVFSGCASASAKKDAEISKEVKTAIVNTQTKDYLPDAQNVKTLGRTYFSNDILWLGYSSSGAEFNINAKRLDITVTGDSRALNTSNAPRIVVFINGERKLDKQILSGIETYTVFDESESVKGIVQVLKVSEITSSIAGLMTITVDEEGIISPASERDLKIEYIGDSITCGYGVDDENKDHHFATATEDSTKAYAYKTSTLLDADYSMVSISGWGVISAYSGDGNINKSGLMPQYYTKYGFTWGSKYAGVQPQDIDWDFSRFVPDVIVVNLGTNDSSYTKRVKSRVQNFTDAYVEFIELIRENNPDSFIICSLGILGQDLYPAVVEAVDKYKKKTGDTEIEAFKFESQKMSDGIAADWHPSEKTHTRSADALAVEIKKIVENK